MSIRTSGAVTIALGLTGLGLFHACTDANMSKFTAHGDQAHIICYSGGQVILDTWSTGIVERSPNGADGYYFKDATDGRLKESSGECVIDYGAIKPTHSVGH